MRSDAASGSTGRTVTCEMSLASTSNLESKINTDFSSESSGGKGVSDDESMLGIVSRFRNKNMRWEPFREAEPEKAGPGSTYGEASTSVMHSTQLNARGVGRGAGPEQLE